MKDDNDEVESVVVRKVNNGYVVSVTTESEEKELVFLKQIHVIKYLKEVFRD